MEELRCSWWARPEKSSSSMIPVTPSSSFGSYDSIIYRYHNNSVTLFNCSGKYSGMVLLRLLCFRMSFNSIRFPEVANMIVLIPSR